MPYYRSTKILHQTYIQQHISISRTLDRLCREAQFQVSPRTYNSWKIFYLHFVGLSKSKKTFHTRQEIKFWFSSICVLQHLLFFQYFCVFSIPQCSLVLFHILWYSFMFSYSIEFPRTTLCSDFRPTEISWPFLATRKNAQRKQVFFTFRQYTQSYGQILHTVYYITLFYGNQTSGPCCTIPKIQFE